MSPTYNGLRKPGKRMHAIVDRIISLRFAGGSKKRTKEAENSQPGGNNFQGSETTRRPQKQFNASTDLVQSRSTLNQSPPTLEYIPLNNDISEIRILNIIADDGTATVRCTLSNVSLRTSPVYAALSYCWGELSYTRTIMVNNCPFQTTSNLEAGLHELRRQGVSALWVDALCINQDDSAERGHQVSLMADLYSKASETFVWLGVDSREAGRLVFPLMELVATKSPVQDYEKILQALQDDDTALLVTPEWQAFFHFCDNPYWTRTWVIQELALSHYTKIVWGQSTMSIETFRQTIATIWFDPETEARLQNNLINSNTRSGALPDLFQVLGVDSRLGQPSMLLIDVLDLTQRFHASEIRDKVFGILALCVDAHNIVPTPNYEQTLDDMLHKIAVNMLSQGNRLELICLKSPCERKSASLPSWVPDWHDAWKPGGHWSWISLKVRRLCDNYYTASGNSQQGLVLIQSQQVLETRGLMFDCVTEATDLSSKTKLETERNHLEQKFSLLTPQQSVYGYAHTRDAIWRTLVMDRRRGGGLKQRRTKSSSTDSQYFPMLWVENSMNPLQMAPEDLRELRNLKDVKLFGKSMIEWAQDDLGEVAVSTSPEAQSSISTGSIDRVHTEQCLVERPWGLENFVRSIEACGILPRQIIITQKGYIGLGTAQCKPGDQICLIAGCCMPIILRKCEGGHTVVGEAYIHGIMDGEAWDENLLRTFLLH